MSAIQEEGRVYDEEDSLVKKDAHSEEGGDDQGGFLSCLKHGLLPHGSLASSGFNLAAATLGAGTLGLPAAMQTSGVILGTFFLVLTAIGTVLAIRFLVVVLEKTGFTTYEALAKHFVGPWFEKLTAALVVLFCWGVTILYVRAMGDILKPLTELAGVPAWLQGEQGSRILTSMFWACFMMPLSLMKEINSLRYASLVGMVATVVLVTAITIHAGDDGAANAKKNLVYADWTVNMVLSLTTYCFSYCCQTNAFEIYAELKNPTPNRMTLAAAVSMACCTVIYVVAGTSGYADFGSAVRGDILRNYSNVTHTVYLLVAFLSIAVTLTMAFPICIFPTRDAALQVLGYKDAYTTPTKVRLAVCFGFSVLSLIAGLFVPGMRLLFGVLGGICGSSLAYTWPGLFYLKTFGWSPKECGYGNFIVAWIMLTFGSLVGVVGTIVAIVQAAQN